MFSFSQLFGGTPIDVQVGPSGGVTGFIGGNQPLSFDIGSGGVFFTGAGSGLRSSTPLDVSIPTSGPITFPGGTATTTEAGTFVEFPNGFLTTGPEGTFLVFPGGVLSSLGGVTTLNQSRVAGVQESGFSTDFLSGMVNVAPDGSGEVSFPTGGVTFGPSGTVTLPGGVITYGGGTTTIDLPFFSGVF